MIFIRGVARHCDTEKNGGGDGPDHLRVVSPGQRPRDRSKLCLSDFFRVLACAVAFALVSALSVLCILRRYVPGFGWPSVGPKTFRVHASFMPYFCFCYLGGGSLGAAHGPRHPAYPLLLRPVISSWGFRFLSSWFLGSAWVFRSEAEILCALLSALQDPTPVRIISGSLSFPWLFGCFFCSPSSRLSFLSSPGAGEPQTALRFVVPLVFSSWPRSTSSTRTSATAPTPRRGSRTCGLCVFFWFVFVVGVSLSLSLSLSLWCRSPLLCKHLRENTWGWPTRRRPQLLSRLFLASFGGKSIGQCPGQFVLSCRCSPHFLPQSPKVGAGRGSGGGNRIVTQMRSLGIGQVLSRKFLLTLPLVERGNAVRFSLLCFFFRSGFCPLPFFGKVLFFSGSVFAKNFRERAFVFAFFFGLLCF